MVILTKSRLDLNKGDIVKRKFDNTYCKYIEKYTDKEDKPKFNYCYFKHSNDIGGFLVKESLVESFFEGMFKKIDIHREVDYQ